MSTEYSGGHLGWLNWRRDARRDPTAWTIKTDGKSLCEPFFAVAPQWNRPEAGLWIRIEPDGAYSHGAFEPSIFATEGEPATINYEPDAGEDGDESGEPRPASSMAAGAAALARIVPALESLAPWFFLAAYDMADEDEDEEDAGEDEL
jgi:hypothetical protein